MAPLSLKIVQDEGAVTRTLKFESTTTVAEAQALVKEKILTGDDGKVYGLFLTSADDERSGIWLEAHRQLDYYMLRDGDQLHYLCRMRNLRVRLLDGSVRTLQVDESKTVEELMVDICARIGITNHDEYGLCQDQSEPEEGRLPAGTGTLTLRRVAQRRERDAKLEQLSKKIKTDDNVEWLEQKSTLRELGAGDAPLLLKRRLFYSDRNVDARDPVQLNLLYVQARDAILEGRHPVTEDQAVEFAGIQCQVHYGDFQEEKHKPGLIENLNEYLPEQYSGSWGIEKKILKEFRRHQGVSPIDAKHLYTKTARDLPTYGVTFFLVKEKQKGKKKLVPRLLGINAESILRLDEVTKEILQVWPLTQVKTYHAGKSETFTLNFGDYSDKEYSVKTNDAHRIRDILQGYIDLIRRRMEAQWSATRAEHHAVGEEYVEASRGNIMEHIQHNSKAVVQETFVGPSKIISYEPGQQITQGTQIMTVQQIVVTGKGSSHQNVLVGEVPMRKDMSLEFVRKLNRLNSNSVKIVSFLAEPSKTNIEEARKLVRTMEADMPNIIEGVQESSTKQPNEEARKKLLDELQELRDAMKSLSEATMGNNVNPEDGEEAAKRIADLSTQMYFSLDPRTIKRGELCRRSRKSFIQDDKMDATLRRASFIAAAQIACSTIDNAKAKLSQSYEGPILDASAVQEVEKAAQDKIGKLNAAVALYLTAYADPKNVDYSAAVTSMNTINELLPELTKDAMLLTGVKDGKSRQELLDEIRALCDAAKRVCLITDPEDHEKIQTAAYEYGRVSEKLLFTFRRSGKPYKPNELVELARDAGHKTSLLLAKAKELSTLARADPASGALDDAGARCADAAKDLLACATVTAPSIHEPHCQSALTAAAETLSSSAQHLAVCWKPLVDDPERKKIGEDLRDSTIDLAKALDRLKGAFAGFNGTPDERTDDDHTEKGHRLKFITTVGGAKSRVNDVEAELNKPIAGAPLDKPSADELQKKLAQRVAQLNAALAALVAATSDRDEPDYATADLAITTITELIPEIVKDGKTLSATKDEKSRADLLLDLKALCDATRGICEASESGGAEELNNSASKFATTSGKLFYMFNPRADRHKEHEILDLSSAACEKASAMLGGACRLAAGAGGEAGTELDRAGARVAAAADTLLTAAQVTAPCMEDPRCCAVLLAATNALASASQQLAGTWKPTVQGSGFADLGTKLEGDRQELEKELERLRIACQVDGSEAQPEGRTPAVPDKRRVQFLASAAAARNQVDAAEKELSKPVVGPRGTVSSAGLRHKLYAGVAQLNAAVAALVAATADREKPDFVAADNAMNTINQLLPQIVKDTKCSSAGEDEKTRAEVLWELRALCAAARGVCAGAGASHEDLNNSAAKFAHASGKLVYVFNPQSVNQDKEQEVLDLSSSACEKASQLLNDVYQLAAEADGATGSQLDIAGSKVADAANALLTTAQLTAPCMQDPRCQATLVSSANALASASQALAALCAPLGQETRFQDLGGRIQRGRVDLDGELERLKKSCLTDSGNDVQVKSVSRPAPEVVKDPRHMKFLSSAAVVDNVLQLTEKELNKPIIAPKSGQAPAALQSELADRLARLNAAIAALLQATADRDKPDYETAEQSIQVINQLMPQVVKDTKALSASKDEKDRAAMLDDLKAMCEATRGICASVRDSNHENLNHNAVRFGTNSGKLFYVVSPRTNQPKEHKIIDLSSQACSKAGELLAEVHQLASDVGGEVGSELDAHGSRTADAAKALLATAQLTAPSIDEPECRASMLAAADALAASAEHLAGSWAAHAQDPARAAQTGQLNQGLKELEDAVAELKAALNDNVIADVQVKSVSRPAPVTEDPRHLKFLSSAAAADNILQQTEKELNKPIVAPRSGQAAAALQSELADRLAQLNAAIAALLQATADRDKPDYETAEQSIQVINQLMPQVVKDTKALSANKDEKDRAAMLDDLKAMCEATRGICASVRDGNHENLNHNAVRFGTNSGKLFYVVSPRTNQTKEHKIIDLSSQACSKAGELLAEVHQLASDVGGKAGSELDANGSRTADAAKALLATAQLTAPSIDEPECRASMLAAADALAASAEHLAGSWAAHAQDPARAAQTGQLNQGLKELADAVEEIKAALNDNAIDVQVKSVSRPAPVIEDPRHLKFLSSAAAADSILDQTEKELNKPIVAPKSGQAPAALQSELADRLSRLNAAIAALLQATADRDKPDYETAEQSIQVINQLMPQVVKDTKALSASKDEKDRAAMLDDLKAMCEATRGICASVRDGNHENLNHNAVRFGTNSGKLFYVVSPRTNQPKEHKIIDLSSQACSKAGELLAEVHQLASDVGGKAGSELDANGSRTADAAKALLATAQLTAPSIHEPQCRASMLAAADALAASAKHLAGSWAAPAQDPARSAQRGHLNQALKELEHAVEELKAALKDDVIAKSPSRRVPPPPPTRKISNENQMSAHTARKSKDICQEFLDRIRLEETEDATHAQAIDALETINKRKTDDEKALQQEFVTNIDAAAQRIRRAEEDVNRIYSAKDEVIPALSVDQTLVVQKQMEQKLALAGVAASNLVACNHPDAIDFAVASKSTTTLSDLMPQIVQDAKLLRGSLNDEERKRFLADVVALFAATKNMLESAKEDRKKLDLTAVEFGNKSAKLLYVVSTDVDPSQEKEVLDRVRNINESASRLAERGAGAASRLSAAQLHALCRAGGGTADAATSLAYTARLVAPSIQNAECNEALTKALNDLSTQLQSYSSTWTPLEASPQSSSIKELRTEAESLEKLLEELRRDLGSGKLVKRRTVERVVVEDTPLRRLACVVQEEAKRRAESSNTLPEQRPKYAKYANELGQAVKELDLAYHRCRQSPHDAEKRQDLEYAVQNLQITLLQTRPSQDGRPQNNIVDLTEYVKEVANDADQLRKECKNGQADVLPVLDNIKQHCEQISNRASYLTTTENYDKTDEVGWMEIEQFAEECDNHLNGINYLIEGLNDGKLKIDLQEKTTRLSEDCNMLRFATKCALASSQGVSLDATLDDLTDLEARIDEMLAQGEKSTKKPSASSPGRARVVAGAARACAGASSGLPPAFAAYVGDVRADTDLSDGNDRERSKDHLRKVLGLLKALTMTTSRHVATWQKLGHPETAEITRQILQELDNHQNHLNATKGKVQSSVLSEVDMNKLLFPTETKVQGDHKQISEQLQQAASKLSSTTSSIVQSARAPASLARSAHAAALALAAHAHALRTDDLAQSQKIDEATKEMSLQTYNVLRTADMLSQEPNNLASRRRLLDACRLLNDAINKLVRTTTTSNKLQRECGELTRSLQLQQALLQPSPQPACALRYADALEALQNQNDVIQKLSSDASVSREEFSRTLGYVSAAVCNTTEYAAQCAYLLSVADRNKEIATEGFIDTSRIKSLSEAVQDTCHRIIRTDMEQAMAEEVVLSKQLEDLQQAVREARERSASTSVKESLGACARAVDSAAKAHHAVVQEKSHDRAKLTTFTIRLLDSVKAVDSCVEGASLAPEVGNVSTEAKARSDDVLKNARALNNNMVSLIREVKAADDLDPMTWVTFGTSRKAVLDMFEALVNSVKENGRRAGVLESSQSDLEEDADLPKKSYVQIQLDLANKWLRRPTSKADIKSAGEESARTIIKLGEQMADDLKGNESEEMLQLAQESKALLADCLKKYDNEKSSALMERLKELRKSIERGVVTRVVEDFLEGAAPLEDLDILAEAEKDETKRKFLLERKIAELLAHLGRVTKTARLAGSAGSGGPRLSEDLRKCSEQTELLAPMLVKAAQRRVTSPDDKAAIEHYQKLLAQYAESLANVRNLCDQAVDPMDFVQTAGETMQRMREDTHDNDPQKCAYASTAITKLANRVINVSLSSNDVRKDPELQKLLKEAREKLKATVPPPNARPSRIPDWKVTTAEILRTTGEVESVLGGEMIFNKQQGTDQPIFAAARDLHTAVREWSARDNDIVGVAKRMAVLMAKLSDYMNTDRKRELLATSKSIVEESHEVAELARKLAHECTDVRIKTNLLQVCERIPTISGQLKMLATVKGSSLGHQGLKEDQEDMIMLVGNAQNLMLSVQEVVKAAASASVKIASQRGGPRIKWVRKNYY